MITRKELGYLLGMCLCFAWLLFNACHSYANERINNQKMAQIDLIEFSKFNVEKFTNQTIKTAQKKLHIPGISLSIVKNGKFLFSKGYGWSDEKNRLLIMPEKCQIPVASISKALTFTALMQFVENGRISLEDSVSEILEFEDINGQYSPITVQQLINHTAGFEESFFGTLLTNDDLPDPSLREYIRKFRQQRVRPNGEHIVYSNYGVSLAGAIIEKISGVPFEDYMHDNLLFPLGMHRSEFSASKIAMEGSPNRVIGHAWTGEQYIDNRDYYLRRGTFPSAGLKTTANDMAKFMLFHLTKGQSAKTHILSPETLNTMHTQLKRNHPQIGGNAYGFWSKNLLGYTTLEHEGILNGVISKMVMIPQWHKMLYLR